MDVATRTKAAPLAAPEPIVIETPSSRSGKKKRKQSKRVKQLVRIDEKLTKQSRRIAKATIAGIESWQKRSSSSARKKRDGALRDGIKNSAQAYAKFVEEASRVHDDIIDLFYPSKG